MSDLIHPTAIVEDGAKLGAGVQIGPYCYVGPNAELGSGTVLHSHAIVKGHTILGENCELDSHAVLGGAPQVIGLAATSESRLIVGNRSVFREHTTVNTGSPAVGGITRVGDDCYIMIGSHIAHDCQIGNKVTLANSVALAGHIDVGDNVIFGGMAAVHQFTRIGRNAFIGGGAILVEDVIPFGAVMGNRAKLSGLNVIGLKRNGYSREQIKTIRQAYRGIFFGEGTFQDRVEQAAVVFVSSELGMEIVEFIRASGKRAICKPAT